jgi:hypothetical protein
MNGTSSQTIKTTFNLDADLIYWAQKKAQSFNTSLRDLLQEILRKYLLIEKIVKEKEEIPYLSEELEEQIAKSNEDFKNGRFSELDPDNEKQMNSFLGI